jgi:hypothetical protein
LNYTEIFFLTRLTKIQTVEDTRLWGNKSSFVAGDTQSGAILIVDRDIQFASI